MFGLQSSAKLVAAHLGYILHPLRFSVSGKNMISELRWNTRPSRKRAARYRPSLESLEERISLATDTWTGTDPNNPTDWWTSGNWSLNRPPNSSFANGQWNLDNTVQDDVQIPSNVKNPTITRAAAAQSITLVNTAVVGGTLDVRETLNVGGQISINNGCQLLATASITANQIGNSGIFYIGGKNTTIQAAVTNATGGELATGKDIITITGNVSNAATVEIGGVGQVPGSLNISGNFTQTANGTLKLYGSGNFTPSVLTVSGTATLAGILATASDGTANPTRDKTITVLIAGSVNQTFATTDVAWGNRNKWNLTYGSTDVVLRNTGAGVNNNGMIFPGTDGSDVYLGHFTDLGVYSSSASDYTITVDWGNGVTTIARIDYFDQGSESEVYAPSGCDSSQSGTMFLITVTITDNVGGGTWQQQIYAYVF